MTRPTLTEFATSVLGRKLEPYQKRFLKMLESWKSGDRIVLIYPPMRVRSAWPLKSNASETFTE